MLASGTQVQGFEPGQSRLIFQGKKFLSMPSFGGEVKPSIPYLRHVKDPFKYCESRYLTANFTGHLSPIVSFSLIEVSRVVVGVGATGSTNGNF
jgi:hypothetical protein